LTTKDEINMVQSKLNSLKAVLDLASRIVSSHNLFKFHQDCEDHQKTIERISRQLDESESLNCGGQFVWIDSVLVNCLRDGHWLLIDNVNFCR